MAAVKAKKWVDQLVESLDALMAEELVVELEILKAAMKEIGQANEQAQQKAEQKEVKLV